MNRIIIVFLIIKLISANSPNTYFECSTFHVFKGVCHFYDFDSKNCKPYQLNLCEIFRTTFDEPQCPVYECKVATAKNTTEQSGKIRTRNFNKNKTLTTFTNKLSFVTKKNSFKKSVSNKTKTNIKLSFVNNSKTENLKMSFSEINCKTKTCEISRQTNIDPCIVFMTNENPNCSIPCNLQYCESELRYGEEYCDIWLCTPKPTPIPPNPTPVTPTPEPRSDSSIELYLSITINVLLVIVLCFLCRLLLKQTAIVSRMRLRFEQVFGMRPEDTETENSNANPPAEHQAPQAFISRTPIIRTASQRHHHGEHLETQPLLSSTRRNYLEGEHLLALPPPPSMGDLEETSFIEEVAPRQFETDRSQSSMSTFGRFSSSGIPIPHTPLSSSQESEHPLLMELRRYRSEPRPRPRLLSPPSTLSRTPTSPTETHPPPLPLKPSGSGSSSDFYNQLSNLEYSYNKQYRQKIAQIEEIDKFTQDLKESVNSLHRSFCALSKQSPIPERSSSLRKLELEEVDLRRPPRSSLRKLEPEEIDLRRLPPEDRESYYENEV